ncbi:hypothetical protein [uncultured Rummeliibacillus sp.]|uniref:hypothetical protein n=1 Tax=uncultured Rummeliibacillus sp. TaxID=762292 RepID=UPI00263128CD|nr:hypothetical protein [uncultured Rummeliibacillus sp.]
MEKELLEFNKVASYEPEADADHIYAVVGDPYLFLIIMIVSLIFIFILIRSLRKNKK